MQRTSDYVYQHSKPSSTPQQEIKYDVSESHQAKQQEADLEPQCYEQEKSDRDPGYPASTKPSTQATQPSYKHRAPTFTPREYETSWYKPPTSCKYDPSLPKEETSTRYAYTPHHDTPAAYPNANQATVDLAKFLAKRELVTQGLVKFSDRPQHFRTW